MRGETLIWRWFILFIDKQYNYGQASAASGEEPEQIKQKERRGHEAV